MNCPTCNAATYVQSTTGNDRRRKCTGCGQRFTTEEVLKDEIRALRDMKEDARELAEKIVAGA